MKSLAEQLRELREARDAGDLTQEQFELFKADLLRQMSAGPSGAEQPPQLTVTSRKIGAYHLLAELGRGGMGVVYRARHQLESQATKQGGDVALKLMHVSFSQDAGYRARFEREADVGLQLDHPGIVRVYDLVVDAGQLALVMKLVQGRSLAALLEAESVPMEDLLIRFDRVLDAMRYAHEQGVLHRDLKPANRG